MSFNLNRLAIAASAVAAFGVGFVGSATEALATDSTYQDSCINITVVDHLLSADCRTIFPTLNSTSIPITGIDNIDGVLTFNGSSNPSSYQLSCFDISVSDNVLSANCRRIFGDLNPTSIVIPGIANINGTLTSDGSSNDSTYQLSCFNISVADDILSAECEKIFNNTSIYIQGIDNIDGVLTFNDFGIPSTYQRSCQDISVSGNVLSANCQRIFGDLNPTSIVIPGINNIDGVLSY